MFLCLYVFMLLCFYILGVYFFDFYVFMSSYPPNFNQSYQVSHEQSFKAITNNNNSETTPAGTNHFQVMYVYVCMYVCVRVCVRMYDLLRTDTMTQLSDQAIISCNQPKQSPQAISSLTSEIYLTVRPHPQGPSIFPLRLTWPEWLVGVSHTT